MKLTLMAALLLAAAGPTLAQTAVPPTGAEKVVDMDSAEFKQKVAETEAAAPLMVSKETAGSALDPKERQRLEMIAQQLTDKTLQRYHSDEGKKFESAAMQMKRRADDIADEALAGGREKVLKFLGIDAAKNANLYYFVSFSMPVEMMRSYVLEAMWSGGTVVVRGIPKGRTMKDFFTEDLRQLIYSKGASANISLDPRLFEAYNVQAVPAIVYTEDRSQLMCAGQGSYKVMKDGREMSYDNCAPLEASKYWKISGAVTSDYALRTFVEKGAPGAQVFHNALRKGMAPGVVVPQGQQAFTGDWKDAISPDDIMTGRKAIEEARQKHLQGVEAAAAASATLPAQVK